MRTSITYQPADRVSTPAIVDAFNEAYRDYFRPLSMTPRSFSQTVTREAIAMHASVVALDRGRAVGTAFLGVRPPRGWIGGVGVIPEYRRRGVARRMMETLLEQAQSLGLRSVQLEVITVNHHALTLYQSLGFVAQRRLLLLTRSPGQPAALPANGLPTCQLRPTVEVLSLLPSLDPVSRSWSRDAPSLEPYAELFSASVALDRESARPVGACLYSPHPFQVGLVTLAGSHSAGVALLNQLHSAHPDSTVSYLNVPEDDPLLPELYAAGYEESLAQFEMLHNLRD